MDPHSQLRKRSRQEQVQFIERLHDGLHRGRIFFELPSKPFVLDPDFYTGRVNALCRQYGLESIAAYLLDALAHPPAWRPLLGSIWTAKGVAMQIALCILQMVEDGYGRVTIERLYELAPGLARAIIEDPMTRQTTASYLSRDIESLVVAILRARGAHYTLPVTDPDPSGQEAANDQ